jgi:hypothetical protein
MARSVLEIKRLLCEDCRRCPVYERLVQSSIVKEIEVAPKPENRFRSSHMSAARRDCHNVEGGGGDRLETLVGDVILLGVGVARPALGGEGPSLGRKR